VAISEHQRRLQTATLLAAATETVPSTLYRESSTVAAMSPAQVAALRQQMQIAVRGKDVPRPVASFEDCGFPLSLRQRLRDAGYETPTPIQMQAIPVALSGCDLLAAAQTGSGKSASS
jgi:hypothetical protein